MEAFRNNKGERRFVEIVELYSCGLGNVNSKLLYLREPAKELISSLGTGRFIHILGPPGSGKSCITWLWSCITSSTKSIRWIYLGSVIHKFCDLKKSSIFGPSPYKDRKNTIENWDGDILVLDGITNIKTDIVISATSWWLSKPSRKLVLVSVQMYIRVEEVETEKILEFHMPSWTLDEYRAAMACPEFSESIEEKLGDGESIEGKLMNKYVVAGGSARWMFGLSLDKVYTEIRKYKEL
eukprot:TRINITY_DN11197_c0_g1_i1.p1 TRINITY_DN11197_c0_g1~~TRINITY_DN11197_c0_g1_i1.p1  ORF type:complete len:239 (-),score=17.03 TRINITY_DN11197_c0_g1_i1:375-1091(-)